MATIIDLLMALNRGELPALPAPANPMSLGPLQPEGPTDFSFSPEEPPTAPADALDRSIIDRAVALAGTAPTPPAPRGKAERILNALMGFSAGVAGQGPQFLQQLQEPRRRYERELSDFNQRRSELGLRGTMAAEDKQMRSQERRQRAAERRYEQEREDFIRRTGITHDEAKEQVRRAFDIQKIREQERIADERLQKQQEQQNKIELARLASKYRALGAKELATELAQKDLDPNYKLSPRAEKWYSARVAIDEARLRRAAGGTGTGAGGGNAASLERQFNSLKAQFLRAEKRTTDAPHGDRGLQSRTAAQILAVMDKLAKLGYEVGFDPSGVYPYIKPPRGQSAQAQPAAPQAQQNDPLGIRQ